MSNRLDEIFSVEKLRRAWKGEGPPAEGAPSPEADGTADEKNGVAPGAGESYQRLRATIERCLPPEGAAALEPLLVELEELLRQRFPADSGVEMSNAERAKITMAVDGLLNRIEDLVEAIEVGSTR